MRTEPTTHWLLQSGKALLDGEEGAVKLNSILQFASSREMCLLKKGKECGSWTVQGMIGLTCFDSRGY